MANDKSDYDESRRGPLILLEFPGEEFSAHAGSQWLESAESRLTPFHFRLLHTFPLSSFVPLGAGAGTVFQPLL